MEVVFLAAALVAADAAPPVRPYASLVARLGDDDFRAREKASVDLAGLLDRSAAARRYFSRHARHPDPEVARRIQRALVASRSDLLNSLRPRFHAQMPTLDGLPVDFPDRSRVLRKFLPAPVVPYNARDSSPHWERYRQGTRDLVAHLHDGGWDRDRILDLLDQMVERNAVIFRREGNADYFARHLRPRDPVGAVRSLRCLARCYASRRLLSQIDSSAWRPAMTPAW